MWEGLNAHWQQLHFSASALAPSSPLHTQSLAHFSHPAGQQEQQPVDKMRRGGGMCVCLSVSDALTCFHQRVGERIWEARESSGFAEDSICGAAFAAGFLLRVPTPWVGARKLPGNAGLRPGLREKLGVREKPCQYERYCEGDLPHRAGGARMVLRPGNHGIHA